MALGRPAAICLASLLGCAALGAEASECLTADDLLEGIHVDYSEGGSGIYRAVGDDLVEFVEMGTAEGGGDLRFVSRFGLYDIEASARIDGVVSPDHRVRYDYEGAPLAPPMAKALAWTGQVVATFPGDHHLEETAAYVFGEEGRTAFGDCSYRSLPVNVTFIGTEGWESQAFVYFPDLGFAALIGHSRQGSAAQSLSLAALRPNDAP